MNGPSVHRRSVAAPLDGPAPQRFADAADMATRLRLLRVCGDVMTRRLLSTHRRITGGVAGFGASR
ncbi:hypothetical protein GCM10023205_68010 [Yinghuangia aomiensis]|uniref:Uncharacterized protein n=1 Tax=Yinghuangia aomiensis TaxID=676205 RepID=A0ABP9I435_9ACTN